MSILNKVFRFYYEGFKNMTVGKTLWLVIIVKLFIMYFILKIFFFQDFLDSKFESDEEKGNYVREELIKRNNQND